MFSLLVVPRSLSSLFYSVHTDLRSLVLSHTLFFSDYSPVPKSVQLRTSQFDFLNVR